MAYGDFKDLARRTASDNVLRDKAFNIAKNPKYYRYQRGLASMVYKFFDKKSAGKGVTTLASNEKLAEELHKPIIKIFKKRTVCSVFKDNIWSADLADTQSISKLNKGFSFLLFVSGIFSKYAWFIPLKDKKGVTIACAFQKFLDKSNRKPNKISVDKGSEFYNSSFKKWLNDNDIDIYSIHNEGKSVAAERFIRTLKTKIYKHMISTSKNVYIDKLDDLVDEYNSTYHRAIKIKPVDVKDNAYIDSSKEVNNKDRKFKVSDHIKNSKYKNISVKAYTPNWSEEVFVIKKVKKTVP